MNTTMKMMTINIKKLDPNAVIPQFAKTGDAGLDLTAISKLVVNGTEYGYIEYGTGLAIKLPPNLVGLLFPRSSISNTGMILANSVGVIDEGYTGEIKLRFKYIKDTKAYEIGERVGQLVIIERPSIELIEVDELELTEREESGFGSTN